VYPPAKGEMENAPSLSPEKHVVVDRINSRKIAQFINLFIVRSLS
jgi:hypothetical protein